MTADARVERVVRIEPGGSFAFDPAELWRYRWMLYFLVWRDLKVRYRNTVLGASWAFLQPALAMAVFTVVFGRLAKLSSDGAPYPVFAYVALVPWTFIATCLHHAAGSVTTNANLIKKVYFPRVVLPLGTVVSGLVDLAVASLLAVGLAVGYGLAPGAGLALAPVAALLAAATALGATLLVTALSIRFPDVRHLVPLAANLWLFASPVAYSSSLIPERWFSLYALNPVVGVVEAARFAVLGHGRLDALAPSALAASLLLAVGLAVFSRVARTFPDLA